MSVGSVGAAVLAKTSRPAACQVPSCTPNAFSACAAVPLTAMVWWLAVTAPTDRPWPRRYLATCEIWASVAPYAAAYCATVR